MRFYLYDLTVKRTNPEAHASHCSLSQDQQNLLAHCALVE
jgi:hypothetical protein